VSQTTDSNQTRSEAGVTLVELLVVITLVSILMMIGIPSYKYVTNSARVSGEINSLLADMQLARSEAVKEGSFVSICASSDSATCSTSNNGWNKGWIVFSDVNGNGTFDSSADALIKVGPAFNSNDVITTAGLTGINVVTFNREGFAALPSTSGASDQTASGVTLMLNVTPSNTRWERCLNITWVGAMTTERGGDVDTACN
jgi:type IV fimbrial biogenesis protein FimT